MNTIYKSATPSLPESGGAGEVLLTFAEYNRPDHDGDTFLPGSIPDGKVFVSAFQHGSSRIAGDLPVGVADVWSDNERAYAKAKFNLNTAAGRDTYEMIKQAPDIWEFSWGFNSERATQGPQGAIYAKVDQLEVTPVIRGAGRNTGVLEVKSATEQAFTTDEIAALKALVAPKDDATEPEPEAKENDTQTPFDVDVLKALAYLTPRED